jgi:hypothetical protein
MQESAAIPVRTSRPTPSCAWANAELPEASLAMVQAGSNPGLGSAG